MEQRKNYTNKKRNFRNKKNFKNKKQTVNSNVPVAIKVRFLHWDVDKFSSISFKPYYFKLSDISRYVIEKYKFNQNLVMMIKDDNGKVNTVVVEKWITGNPKKYDRHKEVNVVLSHKIKRTGVPTGVEYDNVKDMYKDIAKLFNNNKNKLKWQDK